MLSQPQRTNPVVLTFMLLQTPFLILIQSKVQAFNSQEGRKSACTQPLEPEPMHGVYSQQQFTSDLHCIIVFFNGQRR
jgi:hypothetical protein